MFLKNVPELRIINQGRFSGAKVSQTYYDKANVKLINAKRLLMRINNGNEITDVKLKRDIKQFLGE